MKAIEDDEEGFQRDRRPAEDHRVTNEMQGEGEVAHGITGEPMLATIGVSHLSAVCQ